MAPPAAPRMELPFWQGGTLWKLESAISMSWLGCAVQLGCGSWLYSTYSNDCCFPSRGDSGIGSSSAGQISLIMFNLGGDDVKGSRLKGLGRQRKASDSFNLWRIWRALKIRGTGLSVPEKWTTSWAPHLLRLEPSFGAAASFGLGGHRASVLKQYEVLLQFLEVCRCPQSDVNFHALILFAMDYAAIPFWYILLTNQNLGYPAVCIKIAGWCWMFHVILWNIIGFDPLPNILSYIYVHIYIYRYIHILPCRIPTCHLIGKRLALARSTEGGELSPKVWISNITQKRVDIKWYEWYQPRNDPMAPHQMSRSDDFGGGAMDQLDPTLVQQRCWSVVRFWNHSL